MTAAQPLSDVLLDAVVTLLSQIDGPDDYWYDFDANNSGIRVSRHSFAITPNELPSLIVRYDGEDLDDSGLVAAYTRTRSKLQFAVECWIGDVESTSERTIQRLLYDVRKKLQISATARQLSGNANNIVLTSITKPERLDTGVIVAEVRGYVDYYYNSTEPSTR